MTRRPPIVPARAGQVPVGRMGPDQTHLVLLAAVNIHQLTACLNSAVIDQLCRRSDPNGQRSMQKIVS